METLIGKTLNRYTILTLLGEGGIGAVYRAWDTALQRDVAMKILSPEYAQRPDFQERFVQEARLAAKLDHPSIVKVHDFGKAALQGEEGETAPGGEPQYLFIVMEYIPGDNLRKMLNDLRLHKQWVVLTEAVQIVHQVALALEYAHNQGVVHLDIKPSNLMLKPDAEKSAESPGGLPYRVVITDLGLAQLANAPQAGKLGSSMGTPAYMSPEQALGQKTDARSDVYSLGILLYELSVGRVPFPAHTIEEAARYHANEAVPLPRSIRPDLPANLERAILKALHKDPARRYSSAAEFAQALEAFLPAIHEVAFRPEEVTQTVSLLTQYEAALADYVEVLLADHVLRSVRMQPGGLTIGRESDNDIVLDNIKVSRHHARITYDGISYWVEDLNSKNGTFLPDGRLNPGQPIQWKPNQALQIGDFQLYLRRFSPDTQPPPGQATPRPGAVRPAAGETMVQTGPITDAIDLFLETVQLSVIPGNRVTTRLAAINRGSLADRLRISVSGIPANWIPNPPPVLRLAPGAQQEIELAIYPPVASQTRPGRYPLTIRAASLEAANRIAEAEAVLTVGVFTQFTSELESPEVWADDRAQVKVEHRGNARQTYTVTPSSREISFDPPQAQVTLEPGETATVEFTPVPRQRPVFGSASVHPFSVKVAASGAQPQIHHGKAYTSALFPVWVLPVLLILCLCAASVAAYGVIDIFQRPARATQTALAGTQVAFLTQTAALDAANQATRQAITATAAWNMQDTDGDGLPNEEELRRGTNPNIPDSDGDTIPDGFEVFQFKCTDPLNPDTDRDGLRDNQDPDPCNASSPTPTPTRVTPTPTHTPIVIVVTATPQTVTATVTATPPVPSITPTPTQQVPPTPLGGSRLIVFASNRDGNYEIYAMLNDGTRQTRVTNNNTDDRSPALSRSGLRTVFVSNRDGNDEIYVMNVDGSDQVRLTDHPAAETSPAWSPDGNRIAFVSDRDGNKEIYVMNANGSGVTRLTNNEVDDDHPSWSPDGSRIVFDTLTASGSSINLINADGSGLSAVVDNGMINQEPVFSPDGSRIAYVSSGTGNFEIYLVNPNGSGQTQLTNLGLNAFSPDWSNDGFWLVFASRLSEQREIYRIDVNGRNPINLTNNAVDDADPSW